MMTKIISFLFGGVVRIHMLRCLAISSTGGGLSLDIIFPLLELHVVVWEESTVNDPRRAIEALATTGIFFSNARYGRKTIVICGSFYLACLPSAIIPVVTAYTMLYFPRFYTALELFAPIRSGNDEVLFPTPVDMASCSGNQPDFMVPHQDANSSHIRPG